MDYWVRDKIPLPNFQNRWIKFPSTGNTKKFAQNLDMDTAAMVFWNTRKGIGRLKIKYHIDGRMECQPMDKADRRRMYADLFGWRMAARFWIPKPLHSIANPSRRNLSCPSWCSVAAFFIYPKVKRNRIQNGGAVEWVIFRACTEMSDTELVTTRPQR